MRKLSVLAVLLMLLLTACGGSDVPPPPDLRGKWEQVGGDTFYHVAEITDDKIEIWWYLPEGDTRHLYWSGSYTPPTRGGESYSWVSRNGYSVEELESSYVYDYVPRDESLSFTYKDGRISYHVTVGHLPLVVELEPVTEPAG